jgi:hypothetical protein
VIISSGHIKQEANNKEFIHRAEETPKMLLTKNRQKKADKG